MTSFFCAGGMVLGRAKLSCHCKRSISVITDSVKCPFFLHKYCCVCLRNARWHFLDDELFFRSRFAYFIPPNVAPSSIWNRKSALGIRLWASRMLVRIAADWTELHENVHSRNTRTDVYTGRVACCHLASHVEYAPRAISRLEKKTGQTDRRTDGRRTIRLL